MATADPPDPFDDVLNLEETYYAEGHTLGAADGARAGRIEGRTFGLEKGLEKAVALGRLGGRADVWAARMRVDGAVDEGKARPLARGGERLRRHVERVRELADAESLSTVNDEESVNAFEDRLREARAKATLVGKMVGEREGEVQGGELKAGAGAKKGGELEDFAGLKTPVAKKEGEAEEAAAKR